MSRTLKARPASILFCMAILAYAIEPIQGYLAGGDVTKAGTNLLSFALTVSFMLIAFSNENYRQNLINTRNFHETLIIALTTLALLSHALLNGSIKHDIFALLRSLLLGYLLYNFCRSIPVSQRRQTLKKIALLVWYGVSITIVAGNMTAWGFYTYPEHFSGYRFFYPSLNELNFVFFASFLVLVATTQGNLAKAAYFFFTLFTFLIIGNKSFIALFFVSTTSYFILSCGLIARLSIALSMITLLVILVSTDIATTLTEDALALVIYLLTEYSSGASKLIVKLSYLDPFSALVSERDRLFIIAAELYCEHYGLLETFFGIGFSNYGTLYGFARNGSPFSYSEIDPVDIFMSYGITGLLLTSALAIFIYSRKNEISDRLYMLRRILVISFFTAGALTGHIYLMGFPVFFFACYTGLCAPSSSKLEMQ